MTLRRLLAPLLTGGLIFAASTLVVSPSVFAQVEGGEEDPEPEVSSEPAEPPDQWDRLLAVQITGGIDTPFGVAGGAIEFTPIRYFTIYAGGGVGRSGGRVAGGVRLQFPMGDAAVSVQGGVGGGSLDWDSGGNDNVRIHRYWEFAAFLHSGISFEYRWEMGLFGRLGLGMDALFTGQADQCNFAVTDVECGVAAQNLGQPIRGWAGLTVGYALDL